MKSKLLILTFGLFFPFLATSQENTNPELNTNSIEGQIGSELNLNIDLNDADGDPINLIIEGLPDWLSLEVKLAYESGIVANMTQTQMDDITDGSSTEASIYDMLAITSDGNGTYYFTDHRSVRKVSNGQVETLINYNGPISGGFDPFRDITFYKGEVYFCDDSRIFRLEGNDLVTVAGRPSNGSSTGINDGPALEAYFGFITSFVIDDEGGFYIADSGNFTIRYLSPDGIVSTIAGNGNRNFNYFQEIEEGPALEVALEYMPFLQLDSEGGLLILEDNHKSIRRLKDGYISTLLPAEGRSFHEVREFEQDVFGNLIAVQRNLWHLYDPSGKSKSVITPLYKKTPDTEPTYAVVMDIERKDKNTFVLIDGTDDNILELSYSYEYSVTGTPPGGSSGVIPLTFKFSDGIGETIERQVDLTFSTDNQAPQVNEIVDKTEVYSVGGNLLIPLFDFFSDVEDSDNELIYELMNNSDMSIVMPGAIDSTDGILTLNVLNVGTTTLTVKATDTEGASVSTNFDVTITQAEATVSFGQIEFVGDGTGKTVSVTTTPTDLNYTLTYGGTEAAPSAIGDYIVVATIDERNYTGEASTTMSIINVAPEAIELSGGIVLENQASGAEVGGLSVTDQNLNDTHTYALPEGLTDNASFSVNGDKLLTATAFDYEEKGSYTVTVEVTDNNGGSYREELSIAIADVNDAPGLGAYDDIQVVQDLGQLSIQIDGLSTGGDASQTVSISTSTSGSVATASTTANSGNESVTVNFETATGVQGNGTIEITVKDDGGTANGGVDTFTRVVNVSVLPANITTTGAGSCGPGSVTLTASGADAYAWYTQPLEGTAFQTGNELTENITEAVTYYVAGVFGADESKLRVPVSAVIFDAPEMPVISNSNGLLSVPEQTGVTYQWLLDGANLDGATAASFTPLVNGSYSVTITNGNGCSATSGSLPVLVTSVEAPEPTIEVLLYPNPTSEFVDLDFGQLLSKGTSIRLMDNTGRELQLQVLEKAAETVRLDVTRLGEGIHLILINDQGLTIRKRLMIKR